MWVLEGYASQLQGGEEDFVKVQLVSVKIQLKSHCVQKCKKTVHC